MKKTWTLVVISLLGLALFSACASNADTLPSPAPSASAMPSATPQATQSPTSSAMPSVTVQPAGVNTVEDARRLSDDVSEEVEKLSELDDAAAVDLAERHGCTRGDVTKTGRTLASGPEIACRHAAAPFFAARVFGVDRARTSV